MLKSADIFRTLPIAEALVWEGLGVGIALAFMISVTALSLPPLTMLSRVGKRPLLIISVCTVTVGLNGFRLKKMYRLGGKCKGRRTSHRMICTDRKFTDGVAIAGFGLLSTTALVIDGKVVASGKS